MYYAVAHDNAYFVNTEEHTVAARPLAELIDPGWAEVLAPVADDVAPVSYTHLRAHET